MAECGPPKVVNPEDLEGYDLIDYWGDKKVEPVRKRWLFEVDMDTNWFGDEYGEALERMPVDVASKTVREALDVAIQSVFFYEGMKCRIKKVEAGDI